MQTLQALLALRTPEDCRRGMWAIVLFPQGCKGSEHRLLIHPGHLTDPPRARLQYSVNRSRPSDTFPCPS